VIEDLVDLIARLAVFEQISDSDALERADTLGDAVDLVDETGGVAERSGLSTGDAVPSALQWHALGPLRPERVSCRSCRTVYEPDEETADLPTCSGCGTRDTWEARQGGRFFGIVGAIDACPSPEELAAIGKRLYGLTLMPDQASVAWSHYRLRKAALEAHVSLGVPARVLVTRIGAAPAASLPVLGTQLYRLQHAGVVSVSAVEWRRIWSAYHARRTTV
jgi:hypothetical protein